MWVMKLSLKGKQKNKKKKTAAWAQRGGQVKAPAVLQALLCHVFCRAGY